MRPFAKLGLFYPRVGIYKGSTLAEAIEPGLEIVISDLISNASHYSKAIVVLDRHCAIDRINLSLLSMRSIWL